MFQKVFPRFINEVSGKKLFGLIRDSDIIKKIPKKRFWKQSFQSKLMSLQEARIPGLRGFEIIRHFSLGRKTGCAQNSIERHNDERKDQIEK